MNHHLILDNISAPVRGLVDVAALALVAATVVKFLPAISAILSVIWLGLRIWNSVLDLRAKMRGQGPPVAGAGDSD